MTAVDAPTYRLDLPWTRPPLSLNDRGVYWAAKARKVREVREAAYFLARSANIGQHERVRIELHYRPATVRGRDSDNLVATYKPCVDGVITDAKAAPDDTDAHVERVFPVIHESVKGEPGRMWLVIRPLEVAS
jgi:crossover junction endodeoxyribonuclease RusA